MNVEVVTDGRTMYVNGRRVFSNVPEPRSAAHPSDISATFVSMDKRTVVTGDVRGQVRVWDVAPNGVATCLWFRDVAPMPVRRLVVTDDRRYLGVVSDFGVTVLRADADPATGVPHHPPDWKSDIDGLRLAVSMINVELGGLLRVILAERKVTFQLWTGCKWRTVT